MRSSIWLDAFCWGTHKTRRKAQINYKLFQEFCFMERQAWSNCETILNYYAIEHIDVLFGWLKFLAKIQIWKKEERENNGREVGEVTIISLT